jgi:hypothetical protein
MKSLLAALCLLVLTGCTGGSQAGTPTVEPPVQTNTFTGTPSTVQVTTTPPGPPPTPTAAPPTAAPSPASGRCTAAVLRGVVEGGNPAAGNRYAKLVVTNTGASRCTLYGYGGFQLVGADGAALPTRTMRDEPPGPSLVALAPGESASKNLHWGVVHTGDEPLDRPCQPEPRSARIIPPDETEPFTVDWPFGPVCAHGTMHDSAYYR